MQVLLACLGEVRFSFENALPLIHLIFFEEGQICPKNLFPFS